MGVKISHEKMATQTGLGPPAPNRCGNQQHPPLAREGPAQGVTRQPQTGGFDCEFVERPPQVFQCDCPICLLVLHEPHQVECCGKKFCEACIKRVQNLKKPCPACNENNFTTFRDKGLKQELYSFHVYCSHKGEGCEWVGELRELEKHLNLQPPPEALLLGCQFSEVECTYCVRSFQRRYIGDHQTNECPKRPFSCEHCKAYNSTYEDVTKNHWSQCSSFPVACPQKCGLSLPCQNVEVHLSSDCPLVIVDCEFKLVGCKMQLARKNMPSHMSENLVGHLSLLQTQVTAARGEDMAVYMSLLVDSFQRMALDIVSLRSKLAAFRNTSISRFI